MKNDEKNSTTDTIIEDATNSQKKRIDEIVNTSIEQIDDSELPQSLKDKFKVC